MPIVRIDLIEGKSEEYLFVPGGSAVQILVPWKPVVYCEIRHTSFLEDRGSRDRIHSAGAAIDPGH